MQGITLEFVRMGFERAGMRHSDREMGKKKRQWPQVFYFPFFSFFQTFEAAFLHLALLCLSQLPLPLPTSSNSSSSSVASPPCPSFISPPQQLTQRLIGLSLIYSQLCASCTGPQSLHLLHLPYYLCLMLLFKLSGHLKMFSGPICVEDSAAWINWFNVICQAPPPTHMTAERIWWLLERASCLELLNAFTSSCE